MRLPINLATEPRENLRPVRTAVIAAALVALVLGSLALRREIRNRNEFRSMIQQQDALEFNLRDLAKQQNELEAALSTNEAQQIRQRSGFMNSLIMRKSLSWTQLFMDLEKTLPARARITAIQPKLNESDDVDLDLTVASASMEPLVEFLKNLESSKDFGPPVVGSQHYGSGTSSDQGIELVVTTRYAQNRSRNLPAKKATGSASPVNQKAPEPEEKSQQQEQPVNTKAEEGVPGQKKLPEEKKP